MPPAQTPTSGSAANTNPPNRDDDSLFAAKVDVDGAKERIRKLEETLESADKLGELLADAAKRSSVFRKALADAMLELLNDHDTRKELKTLLAKVDREAFWRWGKYIIGAIAWAATVVGGIAIFK